MATKRFTKSAVDWAKMAERVPENQKAQFIALKTRSDNYLRRVYANPEVAPKLDFAAYKSKVGVTGLVDNFQKQYEALKVPYPSENLTPKIAEQQKLAAQQVQEFIVESNKRIAGHQAAIAKWDKILPFEEMTMEDFAEAFPEHALDPVNRPTMWPHTEEVAVKGKRDFWWEIQDRSLRKFYKFNKKIK